MTSLIPDDDAARGGPELESRLRVEELGPAVAVGDRHHGAAWLNSMAVGSPSGSRMAGCASPDSRSTRTARLSSPAMASVPSGENAMALAGPTSSNASGSPSG